MRSPCLTICKAFRTLFLEKGMAIHSRILAWKIPWTDKPGGLQSMGSQRVEHNWATEHIQNQALLLLFWPYWVVCGILVSQSVVKPKAPALGAQSLNYWTTREVPTPPQTLNWMCTTDLGDRIGLVPEHCNKWISLKWSSTNFLFSYKSYVYTIVICWVGNSVVS